MAVFDINKCDTVGIPALGTGLAGICTVDQTRSTCKTESHLILELRNLAPHKTIFYAVIDR